MEMKIPWWMRKKEGMQKARPVLFSDYQAVAAVGKGIVSLLQRHMVPQLIPGRDGIALVSPQDHGDVMLGVYLYEIQENGEVRENGMQPLDEGHQQYPPMYLNLYYMLCAYSTGEVGYREEEQQQILTRAMQIFHDYPVLDAETLLPAEASDPMDLRIEYQNVDMERKNQVWSQIGVPSRLSLFYRVAPVRLKSTIQKEITRVTEIHMDAGQL